MRRVGDAIEIKSPPLERLNKKRPSCLKRGCMTGCLFFVLAIVGFFLFLRAVATPNTIKTGLLPNSFPNSIPIYDKDAIETVIITKRTDSYKKITGNTIFIWIENLSKNNAERISLPQILPERTLTDRVEITWENLNAQPSFIFRYYQTELAKVNFEITVTENTDTAKELIFNNKNHTINGTLLISDTSKASGTDTMRLMIVGNPLGL